jgi:hypothetical protein
VAVDVAHALVDPAVDLGLDPLEKALDQVLVVARAQLAAGRDGGLQLLPGGVLHRPIIAHAAPPDLI